MVIAENKQLFAPSIEMPRLSGAAKLFLLFRVERKPYEVDIGSFVVRGESNIQKGKSDEIQSITLSIYEYTSSLQKGMHLTLRRRRFELKRISRAQFYLHFDISCSREVCLLRDTRRGKKEGQQNDS